MKSAEPTAAYFKPVIVAWRNGAPVRLQDIASVEDSVENDQARAEFDGMRSIIVSVQRQPDANTVEVTDAIHEHPARVPAPAAADHQAERAERPLGVDPRRRCTTCRSR